MIKVASCGLLASPLRAAVDLRAVADVEDVDHAAVVVDPGDDAIGTPPGAVTSGQRPKQRFADPVRIFRQGGRTELQCGGRHGLRQLLCDRAPRGSFGTGARTVGQARSSCAGDAPPGQILAHGGQVCPRLAAFMGVRAAG
jgi:hypothetical protein